MVRELGGDGTLGYETVFPLDDDQNPTKLRVVGQKYQRYDAMTICISKVIDPTNYTITKDGVIYPFRFVYEEIDNDTDMVGYCRFMGLDNIKRNYKWSKGLW